MVVAWMMTKNPNAIATAEMAMSARLSIRLSTNAIPGCAAGPGADGDYRRTYFLSAQ
jgi:hypothetical protein